MEFFYSPAFLAAESSVSNLIQHRFAREIQQQINGVNRRTLRHLDPQAVDILPIATSSYKPHSTSVSEGEELQQQIYSNDHISNSVTKNINPLTLPSSSHRHTIRKSAEHGRNSIRSRSSGSLATTATHSSSRGESDYCLTFKRPVTSTECHKHHIISHSSHHVERFSEASLHQEDLSFRKNLLLVSALVHMSYPDAPSA